MTVVPVLVFEETFATWVPANAKNRKRSVPTNSPITATTWPLMLLGSALNVLLINFATTLAMWLSLCCPGLCENILKWRRNVLRGTIMRDDINMSDNFSTINRSDIRIMIYRSEGTYYMDVLLNPSYL